MMAMATLHKTKIRFLRLLVYSVIDDLVGGVEEGRELSGCCSLEVVDISTDQAF
jgi:hypothetical protein